MLEAWGVAVSTEEKEGRYLLKGGWAGRRPSEVTWATHSHPEARSLVRSLSPGVAQTIVQNDQLIFTVSLLLFPRHPMFKMSRTPGSFHCPQNVPVLDPPFLHGLPLPYSKSGNGFLFQINTSR